jgi:hypothetical protein
MLSPDSQNFPAKFPDHGEGGVARFGKTNPIFIDENGGSFGVRMRKRQSAKKHGHASK